MSHRPGVPIGSGKITVPASVYETIDWNDHYRATKVLLETAFPKYILATHSLPGDEPSSFFGNQTKQPLNSSFVKEIVKTVCEKSGVSRTVVKLHILNKCLYEAKTFYNSQQLLEQEDQENVHPSSSSSKQICRSSRIEPRSENHFPPDQQQSQSTRRHDESFSVTKFEARVPIGSGKITVPASVYEAIDWSDHYRATTELLEAIFPKHILATNSLRGYLQPLNSLFVEEIVKTVCEKSRLSESVVRQIIATVCFDERQRFLSRSRSSQQLPEQ